MGQAIPESWENGSEQDRWKFLLSWNWYFSEKTENKQEHSNM